MQDKSVSACEGPTASVINSINTLFVIGNSQKLSSGNIKGSV